MNDKPAGMTDLSVRPPLHPPATDDLANLCKALGHPARLRILQILLERGTCICGEIVEIMPLSQSTVSEHLRILKQAGWVKGEIEGPRVCYCVDPERLRQFKALVMEL